jgi:hypothetical protein
LTFQAGDRILESGGQTGFQPIFPALRRYSISQKGALASQRTERGAGSAAQAADRPT